MDEIRTKIGKNEVIIKTGQLAKQANGAVTVQCGGTMVLVTCVCSKHAQEDTSFFPLTVEYREKTFAAGKIPGGFFKREGRPTEKEILTARMIDRPIRPLFPDGMRNEVQIIATVLSSDGQNESDVLAILGASAALCISDIPFNGPIGGVRVGLIDDNFVLNPTFEEQRKSMLDLIVVATKESVIMLEAGASQIDETKMVEAVKFGHENLKDILQAQIILREKTGKAKRNDIVYRKTDDIMCQRLEAEISGRFEKIYEIPEKQNRLSSLEQLKTEILERETSNNSDSEVKLMVCNMLETLEKKTVRDFIFKSNKRVDGRNFDQIRSLTSDINLLPGTHGSGLFTRGETQALAVITLGTSADEQKIETLAEEGVKTFMLHYNFPPFSVGETGHLRGPGRREIGHGALAEKALRPVIPAKNDFPYTIRLVSEILESNGSSSMATVCASSLALMAGGVPVSGAVSGVAMGMLTKGDKYVILTDIAGVEDHYGEMDFKVAGTRMGITAVQMDLKIRGISYEIMIDAFEKAKKARLAILDHMTQTISDPLNEIAPNAPRIVTLKIKVDKIRDVIGQGGKVIRGIIAETGAEINIEDDGTCQIASNDKASLDKAVNKIKGIIAEPEVGKVYEAKVTKIVNFGAFCEFIPGQEGLVHVSELSNSYVREVTDVLTEGQIVKVKLIGIDEQNRVKLSIKQVEKDNG